MSDHVQTGLQQKVNTPEPPPLRNRDKPHHDDASVAENNNHQQDVVLKERGADEENQENAVKHEPEAEEDATRAEPPAAEKQTPPPPPRQKRPEPDSPDRYEEVDITEHKDEDALAQEELVKNSTPSTDLEIALIKILERKQTLIDRITGEITKLKSFVRKRKQTYKRKRKEDGAPTRALSAYNMFIKERFAQLAKENEDALKSDDANAKLKRIPPANLVSKTGNEWKELSEEVKAQYEERAKSDRKRYEEEMAAYQPPDKQANRKRNKTGYNMFFSSHVLRLKQSESGVPSERGSVARLVGTAWKQLSNEEKLYYEREADKHNGMHPVQGGGEDEEEEEEMKQPQPHPMDHQYAYPHPPPPVHPDMHMHPPPPVPMHGHQPDPRAHLYYPPPPPPQMYPPHTPYGHYDFSQHHQRHPPQGRQQGYQYPGHRHPYDM